jgi:hypothetical protein
MPRATSSILFLCLLTTVVAAGRASAQTISLVPSEGSESATEPLIAEKAGKELRAYRITGDTPKIDGRFDEEFWLAADSIDDFTQQEPENMAAPSERTVVQVAYDDRYLYVAARCYVKDPSTISAGLGRRGSIPASDKIGIGIDPRHDHLTGYFFIANPSGVQSDLTLFNDTREDNDYEAVWEVATAVTKEGWNAEFRIPFSQIRFEVPDGQRAVWGFQVRRDIRQTGEWSLWVGAPRGTQGLVSRFGHLIFNDRLSPPRRIELMPFTLARREQTPEAKSESGVDGGIDLRVGLGTSTTLSATINPDFGQVELDPAVLNLSVFETFYPEKRPFFLEDSRVFLLPSWRFTVFHSRRIGHAPGRLEIGDDETVIRKPDQTTILGAAKITGKASGWTYGGLTALTAREYATVEKTVTRADGSEFKVQQARLIEPLTMYGVGRMQRDVLNGTSNIGAIGTVVIRQGDLDAFTSGGDFNLRWSRNLYTWKSQWLVTHAPISGVHRTDFGGESDVDYAGKYWGFTAHYDHFGRNFRNTDLGFLNGRINKDWLYGGLRLSQPDPWKFSRNVDAFFYANKQWNDEGLSIFENINWWVGMRLSNYWHISYGGEHNFEFFDDLDTRGGPPIVKPAREFYNFNINSDSRKRWGFGFFHFGNRDSVGGWQKTFGANLRLQPSGRLQANLSTNYTNARDSAQWIANTDADADGIEDQVYGRLKRNVINVTARGTYAFSRDMTLELFLQPFVAVGDYTDIRKLARPRSFDFASVTIADDPDFNRKSLRGNVVLRWEYLRGSTLFVVWNMSTSDTTRPGVFSPMQDLRSVFGARGDHVFVVKMNYWLAL